MNLSSPEIVANIKTWLQAWDAHDLDGVMELMHEDVVFENWTGQIIRGKSALRRAWTPWFLKHGNFRFIAEDIFVDDQAQKALFRWLLEWPSLESSYKGELETRRGVDVLHFQEGKIREKLTYSKTSLLIGDQSIQLQLTSQ
ncbi:MAG: nuclear transport factor 2 family protein [Gammaproteobacteria bacterium]|nr:MAG: nuclear transport factor 2 family protein [Gammaproteobacteria bacterium]